ncbi:MAG: RIP metalloprotease RseP [Deltaproteobacteria bacterium]|nr:RIP metalloprotease RseP [Deltaproteobacteria bacterium]
MTILYFIIAIGILIFVHELGHFIFARLHDIRVESFSIGFGPKIIGFKRGETEYKIAPIPLGGYVNMTGEDPSEAVDAADKRAFSNKSIWTRVKVVSAGPLTNLLFAFILMPVVFMLGRMEPEYLSKPPVVQAVERNSPAEAASFQKGDLVTAVDGRKISTWDDFQKKIIVSVGQNVKISYERDGEKLEAAVTVKAMPEVKAGYVGIEPMFFVGSESKIDDVAEDSVAAKAGILKGDKIIAINGQSFEGWAGTAAEINNSEGREILLTISRDNGIFNVKITPKFSEELKRWVIGVLFKPTELPMVKIQYGFFDSFKNGAAECLNLLDLTFIVVKKLFTGQLSYKALGGPVQIARISAAAASYGIAEFIYFMSFLSLQLGVLNLLPIPVLDGGHILFCGIEACIRRPIHNRVRAVMQYAGIIFLLSFFLLITVNDIDSIWGIKNIIGKFYR